MAQNIPSKNQGCDPVENTISNGGIGRVVTQIGSVSADIHVPHEELANQNPPGTVTSQSSSYFTAESEPGSNGATMGSSEEISHLSACTMGDSQDTPPIMLATMNDPLFTPSAHVQSDRDAIQASLGTHETPTYPNASQVSGSSIHYTAGPPPAPVFQVNEAYINGGTYQTGYVLRGNEIYRAYILTPKTKGTIFKRILNKFVGGTSSEPLVILL